MKVIFCCVLMIIINTQCSEQRAKKQSKNVKDKFPLTDFVTTIPIVNYYDSDSIKESEVMFNMNTNEKEGLARLYYKNGNLKQEGMWHNNKQEGVWKFYNEDGSLSAEVSFKNDYQDGEAIFYNKGIITEKSNWKQGKLNGDAVEYYENGKIKRLTKWMNGSKISESIY